MPIGNNDLWIAAHAEAAGLTVVTNNEREFERVPGLKAQKLGSLRVSGESKAPTSCRT